MSDIADAFHEYFEIVVADTLELKKEVYRLRYRIMCLNTGIFDTTLYPDELEKLGFIAKFRGIKVTVASEIPDGSIMLSFNNFEEIGLINLKEDY